MIYIITNNLTKDCYIGKTINDLSVRFYQHTKQAEYGSQTHLHRAFRKYGSENFSITLLEDCPPEINNDRERHWIANLKPEYNMTEGGDGGWIYDQTGNTWKVKDPSRMGKHTNQWKNDDGTRKQKTSKRMKTNNPSFIRPKTQRQLEASRRSSHIATEASKKRVGYVDLDGNRVIFESKRALIQTLNISYDVLNYRLKTGKMFNGFTFFEENDNDKKECK